MNLPLNSRLWVFQANRTFTNDEKEIIIHHFQSFLKDWNAHGNELTANFLLPYNHFIVVAVDENKAKASGCSIDKLTQLIQKIDNTLQLELLNRMNIAYLINENVHVKPLNQFKEMVIDGSLGKETIIFNSGISTLRDYNTLWKTPLHKSWANKWLNNTI